MQKSSIEWLQGGMVWNPTTGCSKVSAGCKNCYAEAIAKRFWGERKFADVRCHPERLDQPAKVKKPQRVFVDSMSDLFHKDVPLDFILRVWMVMGYAPQHTFIVLTKRPERMKNFITNWLPGAWGLATMSLRLLEKPIPNVWLGVSVEDQKTADERIPLLLQTPAAKRIVSVEPMLERIEYDWSKLDWVIVGGESGPGARPHPNHKDVLHLANQCVKAGVPFFLKQMWGAKMPYLAGQIWDQTP